MNIRRLFSQAAIIVCAVLLSVGVQTLAYTETNATPPANDFSAPLTTSGTPDEKVGGLILNTGGADIGLIVNGGVQIRPSSIACGPTTRNSLRYNSSTGNLELCDGAQWGYVNTAFPASGTGSQTWNWSTAGYTTDGDGNRRFVFTVPARVYALKTVEVWGGGGGGASGNTTGYAGGGGGGGGYGKLTNYAVTPGEQIVVVVGHGGAQGTASSHCLYNTLCCSGQGGGVSSFGGVTATGGGGAPTAVSSCPGGSGGTAVGVSGVTVTSGGTGSTGANGGCPSGAAGGVGGNGGAGGSNGSAGAAPGGGGGGAMGGCNIFDGGPGAAGQVKITW